jgi:uncharacterized membrane protein YqjE
MGLENKAPGNSQRGGLFDSLKTLATTLLSIGRTRLELLSTELEEELVWRSSMLVWTMVALFCAGVGAVLVTLFMVILFWDSNRLLVLGIAALFFSLGAAWSARIVLNKYRIKPKLFSTSLDELAKDREQWTTRS